MLDSAAPSLSRSPKLWMLWGFSITSLFGTLLHFLYELLNGATWIAPFSAVNESTWEHMKLLFWPMLLFAVFTSFFFRDFRAFWCIQRTAILLGLTLIPVFFYTYNGAFGKSPDAVNIAIFFVSAGIAYLYAARQMKSGDAMCKFPRLALLTLSLLAVLFIVFTFRTPALPLFQDPLTGGYGV